MNHFDQYQDDEFIDDHSEPLKDRWLLSFADLLTLLLAFFVVMYSVSAVNEGKLSELAESLTSEFYPERSKLPTQTQLRQELLDQFVTSQHLEFVAQQVGSQEIAITLPGEVLFESGASTLSSGGAKQLTALLPMLRHVDGPIQVEGHTDDQPIATAAFPSNWELSAHRAAATVRFLESLGLEGQQLIVLGLGDTQPVTENLTEAARAQNRRVVIKMSSVNWSEIQSQQSLSSEASAVNNLNDPMFKTNGDDRTSTQPEPLLNIEDVDPELLEQLLKDIEAKET